MRVAIVGGGALGTTCARVLVESGCEVVLIERDAERAANLSNELDCGVLHGDGTRPAILREADPERCQALLCLSGSDQTNVLAAVVGRHLGFPRTLTKIEDPEFETICVELGIGETIVPDRSTARAVVDMIHGRTVPELAALGAVVRLFTFVVAESTPVAKLGLPRRAVLVGVSRAGDFHFADELDGAKLAEGDEVFVLAHVDNVEALEERFGPKTS